MKKLITTLCAVVLVACGGGGGDATVSGSGGTTVVSILDSFGNNVLGVGGFGGGDSGADGTAGDGAPIVGGTILITDAKGSTTTAITDSKGYYRVKINNFTPPFIAQVKQLSTGAVGSTGATRYSVNVTPAKTNGFITINLTSLTSKIASDAAVALGKTDASAITTSDLSASGASGTITSAISTSISALQSQLSSVIIAAGLTPSTFNPLTTPFVANSTGYDYVLDNTRLASPTQIAIKPTFTGTASCPFAGVYSGTISGNDTGSFTANVNASCQLTGSGSTSLGGPVTGSGTVSSTGAASATFGGSTSGGATFTGTIVNHVFSGTWSNAQSGQRGTFTSQ